MITIIGAGKVGGDAALFSALKRLDDQILLLDIAEGLPDTKSNFWLVLLEIYEKLKAK